ncbi:MAG: YceI family protein [Actinobacteria bacterium]|nr:YceI family protein [Actinomycetota bacterium]
MRTTTSVPGTASPGTTRVSGSYRIDETGTQVEVGVRIGGLPAWATFDTVHGDAEVPSDLTTARVHATIDATRLRSGSRRLDRLAATVLDVDDHPVIRFDADRMEPILESFVTHDGDRPLWALVGTLTVCGITRPVRIAVGVVRPTRDGTAMRFEATTTVRCAEFGIRRRGRLIGDLVRVRITGAGLRNER